MIEKILRRGSEESGHGGTDVRQVLADGVSDQETQSIRKFLLRFYLDRVVIGPADCRSFIHDGKVLREGAQRLGYGALKPGIRYRNSACSRCL